MPTTDLSLLNNPIWHSLNGPHAKFAIASGRARRYVAEVSPFFAVDEPTDAAYRDVRDIIGNAPDARMLATETVPPRAGWTKTFEKEIMQMILARPPAQAAESAIEELGPRDVPEMMRLVEATKPGPFAPRTIELGRYVGIRVDGRLAAMAGERMRLPGFTEVSAIAVWPEFRGRGLARILTQHVAAGIAARGETPFLHLFADNTPAKTLYESLGFVARQQQLYFYWLAPA